ncbi:hypothetical protein AGOR_G00008890 [Albula goreensis]|uniref:Helicase senataxin n=1 Tax=Albula goreensis TaxID=1534307 RepID=A0A8T3EBN8_9TELE|nr:hypothetical protein AGOR_G00008890 [Albula goreensis]
MMNTCRWCTSPAPGATDLLQKYCSGSLSTEDEQAVNEDLCFCLECVVEYHRAREELPSLHKRLWELEVARLLARFSQASETELEEDELLIVEDDQEIQVPKFTAAEYENFLRVPLTEILKYPYLMGHSKLSEMCVEALCNMEKSNSFQVFDKYQGIYLLLVHPNEMVSRWAIRAARSLGKVDRDDFYDLQDIFSSMFSVIELDLFQNSDIDSSYDPKNGKMVLLPRHLFDSTNYKYYWLGICMLLTVLDAQAMDSLLLGPDKQTDIMQCILHTMEKTVEDEDMDPFWPSLQCFMVILDRLGSKVWGHLIEPAPAFQTITGSHSYTTEIENIRQRTMMPKVKVEMESGDDMVTCSQIVYDTNIKEKRKDTRKSSTSAECGSIKYEEMHSLVNVLQSDIGQDMRVHNSTFLWFIPFVQSVMELNDLSTVYIGEIVHYLCGEIKDLINGRLQTCDKVTEFFTLILVFVIELHLSKNCMKFLYYSAPSWVEVIVKCATLPCTVFSKGMDSGSHRVSSTSCLMPLSRNPQVSTVVPQACMQVIRSLLKEGGKLTSHAKCTQFLDILNKKFREVPLKEWNLSVSEVKDLQKCIKELMSLMKDKKPTSVTDNAENPDAITPPPTTSSADPVCVDNCSRPLKSEQSWDSGGHSSKVLESRDHMKVGTGENAFVTVKQEPCDPEETVQPVSEFKSTLQLTRMVPDPGRIQVLKSKLSTSLFCKLQDIAKKQPDTKNVKIGTSDGEQCKIPDKFSRDEPLNPLLGCDEQPTEFQPSMSKSEKSGKSAKNNNFASESGAYSDDVPLSAVKGFLKKSQKVKHLQMKNDRDDNLNQPSLASCEKSDKCLFDSDPEDCYVTERTAQKGKNKGGNAQGTCDKNTHAVEPSGDVIVISDSESAKEDDDTIKCSGNKDIENRFREGKVKIKSEPVSDFGFEKSPCHGDLNEMDSQLFEFETQDYLFSAWSDHSDHKISNNEPAQETKKELSSVNEQFVSPGPSSPGYETEPISDEIIENALLEVEEQLKKQKHSVEPKMSKAEKDVFVKPKALPRMSSGKESPHTQRTEKESLKNRVSRTDKQIKTASPETTSSKLTKDIPTHSLSMPAIVPPRKVRKPIEPASTVEKLGLKKKPRKAFELSQRSLDCVDQLRKHGQGVQVEQTKLKRINRKTKVISPKKLNLKGNKRLLASQDLQFFRQSRAKPQSLQNTFPSEQTNEKQDFGQTKKTNCKWNDILTPSATAEEEQGDNKPSSSTTEHISPYFGGHGIQMKEMIGVSTTATSDKIDGEDLEEDGDGMNLTQMEEVDMEMCSQMEEEDDVFLTQRDPVDMDIESDSQISTEKSPWIERLDEGLNKTAAPHTGFDVQEPSTFHPQDDHIFLKPGLSPLSLKKAKPSTTKIYAPSSRSATLVQEMEKVTKPSPPVTKKQFARPVLPARKISTPQPEFNQPYRGNASVPIQNSTIGSSPHVPSYKTYARPETPVNKEMTRMNSGHKFDQSVLINTILRWNYDMFCSYTQFGIPSDLCSMPLKEVASSYKSYEEYFETFYPLLLINTFEELVKDWIKNTSSRQVISHHLKVVGFEYSNKIASATFTACLSDREVQQQLYPKEDDFVILWLPQTEGMYTRDEPQLLEPRAYFGCVSRSNVSSAGESDRPTLNLIIQTLGNVSSVNNQAVKCQLVGSLVSTIREFRALHLLKSNAMFRPILAPQVAYFQPGQEKIAVLSLPEYNQEQVKAINWGVSITTCLTMNRHSKARRLRVLLCAPSNAAIDSLMKKIIVVFKERCRNIQNPLGNCGDINLVRLGMERTISKNLKPFSLDNQTRVRTQKAQQGHDMDIQRRKVELDKEIDRLSQMCAMVMKNTDKFRKLTDQKSKLLKEREQLGRQLKETRSRKQETQAKVLQDAHVICCTLSTSGSMVLESAFRRLGHEPFSCVIVDEARQATEPETLIPMLYRCPALILVGDPDQLPPTVVSQTAKEKKYDQSLMSRLWRCLHRTARENPHITAPVIFLNKQYRMHPDICQFPSVHIYNRALRTDCDTAVNRCAVTWPFQPYRVFDVTDGQETKDRDSFCNPKEVKLVLFLIKLILEKQIVKVGVITPYNAQKYRIQDSINREMAKEETKRIQVEVDTVDGFQGREMDCIIVSCVRASSEAGSIGFLANRQRMNVTITRAKYSLFILGHLRTLREQRDWGALIQDAGKRGTIIKTREKDFKTDAKQIFKPESGFMRSLSYPPKESSFPNRVEPSGFKSSERVPTGSCAPVTGEKAAR